MKVGPSLMLMVKFTMMFQWECDTQEALSTRESDIEKKYIYQLPILKRKGTCYCIHVDENNKTAVRKLLSERAKM